MSKEKKLSYPDEYLDMQTKSREEVIKNRTDQEWSPKQQDKTKK